MSGSIASDLWIVGAGRMGGFYADVAQALGREMAVIGRGEESAAKFTADKAIECRPGGIEAALDAAGRGPDNAVVATNVETLAPVCRALMAAGTKNILVEKPGGNGLDEIEALAAEADANGAKISVAYNRRFYNSVQTIRERVAEEGGVTSFAFEFTEVSDVIAKSAFVPEVKAEWLCANSTHVIDTAFYLGGAPTRMMSHVQGALDWHPRAARFVGMGETEAGALFNYGADWDAPGRWWIEVNTTQTRYILRPMEQLQKQVRGSFAIEDVEAPDTDDTDFKAGLKKQMDAFLNGGKYADALLSIAEHAKKTRSVYSEMLKPWNEVGK